MAYQIGRWNRHQRAIRYQAQRRQVPNDRHILLPVQGKDGLQHQFYERNDFMGTLNGQTLPRNATAAHMSRTDSGSLRRDSVRLNVQLGPDGRTMQGRVPAKRPECRDLPAKIVGFRQGDFGRPVHPAASFEEKNHERFTKIRLLVLVGCAFWLWCSCAQRRVRRTISGPKASIRFSRTATWLFRSR